MSGSAFYAYTTGSTQLNQNRLNQNSKIMLGTDNVFINLPSGAGSIIQKRWTYDLIFKIGNTQIKQITGIIGTKNGFFYADIAYADYITTATQAVCNVTALCYLDGTYNKTETTSFTLVVPENIVPSAAHTANAVIDNAWLKSNNLRVVGYHRINVKTMAEGAHGSTIKSIETTIGNKLYNGNDVTSELINGDATITTKVTDTRGRTATAATQWVDILQYAFPSISNISYERGAFSNGVWEANDQGADIKISLNAALSLTDQGNTAEISASAPETETATVTGKSGSAILYLVGIGTDVSKEVEITLTDKLGSEAKAIIPVPTVNVPMNWNPSLPGLAFGKIAELVKTVEFKNWQFIIDGFKVQGAEFGKDGIWTYIKLQNGIAILFGTITTASCDISNKWGALFTGSYAAETKEDRKYPFAFVEEPIAVPNAYTKDGNFWIATNAENNGDDPQLYAPAYQLVRPSAYTTHNPKLHYIVFGLWKKVNEEA